MSTNSESGRSPLTPALPTARQRLRWTGLYGSAHGLAAARAAERHDGPLLVVAADTPSAQRIESEIRFFAASGLEVLHFPDWETLPYDVFSPHQDIVSERLETLHRLPRLERGVLVTPITTLMARTAPRHYLDATSLVLGTGERLSIEEMRTRLERAGYRCVGQAMEHGEFAVRGSILDLFPMGAAEPYRIDLLDDEIDTIRTFDPESQRSVERVDAVRLLPAREFPMTEEAIGRFRREWRARFEGDASRCPIYRDVSQGSSAPGIEYYLPLFFESTATLLDYLPDSTLALLDEDAAPCAEAFWEHVEERYEGARHDIERPLLPPRDAFVPVDDLLGALKRFARVDLVRFEDVNPARGDVEFATRAPTSLPLDARSEDPLGIVKGFLDGFEGRALLVAESAGRREVLLDTFAQHGLRPSPFEDWTGFAAADAPLGIATAPLDRGAVILDPPLAVITESQLFGERAAQRRRRRRRGATRDSESIIRDLSELAVGAPVVHEDHGVGRYRGLETLSVGEFDSEFLCLEYADGDKLYVPVAALHLVSRYTGSDPELAPLHKLGSPQWQRARKKAAERAFDVAAELLEVQAQRETRPGNSFEIDAEALRAFEATFPFEETDDQLTAIEAVLDDMRGERAMDRLVCGDVGFGKTEVAMRAAFVAVHAGWQVAILVPTTLLAQQHYQTFTDRFADWPVHIESLSRFRTREEQGAVFAGLEKGTVDIVVGTHKLLASDVRFKRLGLTVIDEEHRFGVRQKERMKALRAETDVLTLTATPIPRTLNMALSGLRDLSLIATPPQRRLSIKTFVRRWDSATLREAFQREIRRGGQVYFVHNKVETIERTAREVRELVPDAEVRVAHGQMRERDLERVMLDFYHRRFQILVCTTIIETGIDVPNANTIVINRADRFGLAQLHQLRGRVGRSHHRAYAFLVVPDRRAMTADAVKRLEAIESLEDLGIGFSLATHDLEIRGAGELLGEGQSGQIQEVGYSMYTRLLERAVAALRSGRSPTLDRPLDHGAEIDLHEPALIPDSYLPDVHTRLVMYKRIASAADGEALEELRVEMIDRFGTLPPPLRHLFELTELKLRATPLGIEKIDLGRRGGRIVFGSRASVDPANVVRLVQSEPTRYRLEGADRIRVALEMPDGASRIGALATVLDALETRDAA